MNSYTFPIFLFITFCFFAPVRTVAVDAQLSQDHKRLIEELVSLAGDMEEFKQEARGYHRKLILSRVERMSVGTTLENDQDALNIIGATIDSIIDWEFAHGSGLKAVHYQTFGKRFSEEELEGLVTLYRTDMGKKVLGTSAGLFKEWEESRIIWARSLHSDIRRKVKQRLDGYLELKNRANSSEK